MLGISFYDILVRNYRNYGSPFILPYQERIKDFLNGVGGRGSNWCTKFPLTRDVSAKH